MNIYLTGMMGCGKSSIGRLLAHMRNENFIDLDIHIEAKCGKSISKIFEEEGESAFRQYETEGLKAISKQADQVIATGGGIILRDENVEIMRKNGMIVFIDRPIEEIIESMSIDTRPVLGGDWRRIRTVYDSRIRRYRETSDIRFDNPYASQNEAALALYEQLKDMSEALPQTPAKD